MSNDEMNRFFTLLQDQGKLLEAQGKLLATVEQYQKDTHERLFGSGQIPGAIPYLYAEVSKHGKQLNFWRGGLAVLTFLWGAAVTCAALIFKHK